MAVNAFWKYHVYVSVLSSGMGTFVTEIKGMDQVAQKWGEGLEPPSSFPCTAPKGDVTLVNLQRQLATPIRNACFSHEFADMLHF